MFVSKKKAYPLHWNRMPVDISSVFKAEKPAGKHGFLTVKDGDFVFEDGTKGRFWGTNFNSGANFPSHSHAEAVARRLAAAGLNMVRLHQMDAEWSCPNIFQFTRGARPKDTMSFDPESMDRLDYLIYCLKNEGIYIYVDFLTYRRFKTGDGAYQSDKLPEKATPYCHYNERLKDLQKKFISDFLNHKNPYTGLMYKDEPAIAMAEVINESDFWGKPAKLEPYKTEFTKMLEEYAKEKNEPVVTEDISDLRYIDPLMHRFFCDLTKEYYREMIDYMRSEGMRIPITGTNWTRCQPQVYCNTATDFNDVHVYFWTGDQRSFKNDAHIKNDSICMKHGMCAAAEDMPFFVSEWDAPWPNEFRADTTLWMAAIGALQGYAGFTIHTYRYGTNEEEAETEKIGRSVIIGNSYYRGIFDTYNDPAKFGLFYHAALITRRGDVREGDETVVVGIPEEEVQRGEGGDARQIISDMTLEKHKVRISYKNESIGELTHDGDTVLSDTKEIFRDRENGYGYIDTAKTKAVYGFVGDREISLSGMEIKVKNDFATIAVSTLEEENIENSGNLLLTAVGRADNTDAEYNEEHTTLVKEGRAPILIDVIEAEIKLKTDKENMLIWSVDSDGYLTGIIPSEYKDGYLHFTIGNEFESMYYLIQEQ